MPLKVAVIQNDRITDGGGFSQALSAIRQMARLCENRYDFVVFSSEAENIRYLDQLGIKAKILRSGISDKLIAAATAGRFSRIFLTMLTRRGALGRLERELLANKVDLAYFVSPSRLSMTLQKTNFIATVWDLCHRDSPEFPEVREDFQFQSRDFTYSNTLSRALFVLCDSETLCDRVSNRYGVDRERLVAMPFSPGPFIGLAHSESKETVLERYGLEQGYYFYPAQFWAHKNHVRVLQALALLNEKDISASVVFSGGDKGTMNHVKSTAVKLGVDAQVKFLGFVPTEHIRGLYEGCRAVVMPSYFGPTNLPPLEAWELKKPLLYSSLFSEQSGRAALHFDPDSAVELAKAMEDVADSNVSGKLIREGTQRLAEIGKIRAQTEDELLDRLEIFAKRLECWS